MQRTHGLTFGAVHRAVKLALPPHHSQLTISPQLQQSVQNLRGQRDLEAQSKQAASTAATDEASYDPAQAKKTFEEKCSQCHKANLVQHAPPASEAEARDLVTRMVENGLEATSNEIAQIVKYLTETVSAESAP